MQKTIQSSPTIHREKKNKMNDRKVLFWYLCVSIMLLAAVVTHAAVVKHPSQLVYKKLNWTVPAGSPFRTALKNGLRLYIAEDKKLPRVSLKIYFKAGSINDPSGKEGIGQFMAHLMRTGGTKAFPADSLDALIEHFAINISLGMNETELVCSADFLSQFADTALFILSQILFNPTFEQQKIAKEREIFIQNIQHRFDNPDPVLRTAYKWVMYPCQQNSRLSSEASMKSITREDCVALHASVFRTENAILSIAGDFDKNKIIQKIERLFPQTASHSPAATFPVIGIHPVAHCCIVHKKINQAYVMLGLPLFKRPDTAYYPISLFNLILGGDGFTSRLGTSVRSDAGLTYSIHSSAESNYVYPATFYISFFTGHATVNKAIAITLREVQKILRDSVTAEEIVDGKKVLIDGLPSMFRSKEDIVETYAWNEYYGRPDSIFMEYPARINALTRIEVMAAAAKYLKPDAFTYAIVGDSSELFKAEKAEGFCVKELPRITVINPETLYNQNYFCPKKKR